MISRIALLFLLSITGFKSYSQPWFLTTFLDKQYDCHEVYASYYNYMGSIVDSKWCESYSMESDDFEIVKERRCVYMIRSLTKKDTGIIYFINKENHLRERVDFCINRNIPLPRVGFDGIVNRGCIRGGRKLERITYAPVFEDIFNNKVKFKILSFNADVIRTDTLIYSESVTGDKVSGKLEEQIGTLRVKDKIILRNVVIQDDLGNTYTVPESTTTLF